MDFCFIRHLICETKALTDECGDSTAEAVQTVPACAQEGPVLAGRDVDQGAAFEEAAHTFKIKSQVTAEEEKQVSATPSVHLRCD